jgi:branched-subunit amino acid ABC-type transport system permease component
MGRSLGTKMLQAVDLQQILEWLNQQTPLGLTLAQILSMAIITRIAFLLERFVTRYLRRFAKRAAWSEACQTI